MTKLKREWYIFMIIIRGGTPHTKSRKWLIELTYNDPREHSSVGWQGQYIVKCESSEFEPQKPHLFIHQS